MKAVDYSDYVNPQWVRLLDILQMNVRYQRSGSELFTENGDVILDFLSGYCVHNTGHNHPTIVQSNVPDLAGTLARRLCSLAGGGLEKVFFAFFRQ